MAIGGCRGGLGRALALALLAVAVVAVLAAGGDDGDGARAQGADGRPNVLVVMTDDQTLDHVWAEYEAGDRELYDLDRDPFELRSRHDDPAYQDERAELEAKLDVLRDCAGSTCR